MVGDWVRTMSGLFYNVEAYTDCDVATTPAPAAPAPAPTLEITGSKPGFWAAYVRPGPEVTPATGLAYRTSSGNMGFRPEAPRPLRMAPLFFKCFLTKTRWRWWEMGVGQDMRQKKTHVEVSTVVAGVRGKLGWFMRVLGWGLGGGGGARVDMPLEQGMWDAAGC